jgi:MFS family permease
MLIGLLLAVGLRAAHELVGAGVLPALVRDLGGEAWAGAFFSAQGLAAALGILLGGAATDRRGPVPVLAAGFALLATGMTVTGSAGAMPGVIAGRVLEGLGGGMVSVVVSAVVIEAYDDAMRPRVLAWMAGAWVIPGLVAPGLAVGIAESLGWRVVFFGLVPLVAVSAALVLPPLRRRAAVSGVRGIEGGAGAAGAAGPRPGWREMSGLVAPVSVRALVVFAFFGVEGFLPLAFARVRGASPAFMAGILTTSALAWTSGAFLQSRACRRFAEPVLARLGTLGLVAGICGASAGLAGLTPLHVALASWALAGLGMGVVYNAASASAMSATPPAREGATGAILGISDAVASSVATAIAGVFLAASGLTLGEAPRPLLLAFALAATVAALGLAPAGRLGPARAQARLSA